MKETSYKVKMNYDDFSKESSKSPQCLNNPVATITVNMENKYGKNITELFTAFGQANNFNDNYEGRGNIFYFDFHSQKFAKNSDCTYTVDRSQKECVKTFKLLSRKTSNVEIAYVISDKDWKGKNTTITQLNNNIAKNIAYCLSNSNIQDTNWHVLRQNYYYIAKKNVVYIYACDNTCNDLSVQFPDLSQFSITNQSFVVDITNPTQNNINVKYNTVLTGTQAIPLHFPPPIGPLPSYTIDQYQLILEGVIAEMTEQYKIIIPTLDRVAYTTIYEGKLYITNNYLISSNPVWLEGNGVEITPMYTNTDLSLTDQKIVDNWRKFGMNILTLKNY